MRITLVLPVLLGLSLTAFAQTPTWTPLDVPNSVFIADGDRLLATGEDGSTGAPFGVLVSNDAGVTWTRFGAGLPTSEVAFPVYLRGDAALATTYSGRLFRSLDGGRTWGNVTTGLSTPDPNLPPVGAFLQTLVATEQGFLAASIYGVFRSNDGGASWVPSSSGLPGYTNSGLDFRIYDAAVSGSTVILASSFGIYRSGDSGNTWAATTGFESGGLPLEGWGAFSRNGYFYAFGPYSDDRGGVYRSDDDGRTWTRRSEGLSMSGDVGSPNPGGIREVRSITAVGNALFVGTSGGAGLYRSTDGDTWQPFLHASVVPDPDLGYIVPLVWATSNATSADPLYVLTTSTTLTTVYRVDGATAVSAEPPGASAVRLTLSAPLPNPSQGGSTLRLQAAANVQATLYDVTGRVVTTLHQGPVGIGGVQLRVPLGLAPGIYVVRVESAGESITRRVTVAR